MWLCLEQHYADNWTWILRRKGMCPITILRKPCSVIMRTMGHHTFRDSHKMKEDRAMNGNGNCLKRNLRWSCREDRIEVVWKSNIFPRLYQKLDTSNATAKGSSKYLKDDQDSVRTVKSPVEQHW